MNIWEYIKQLLGLADEEEYLNDDEERECGSIMSYIKPDKLLLK